MPTDFLHVLYFHWFTPTVTGRLCRFFVLSSRPLHILNVEFCIKSLRCWKVCFYFFQCDAVISLLMSNGVVFVSFFRRVEKMCISVFTVCSQRCLHGPRKPQSQVFLPPQRWWHVGHTWSHRYSILHDKSCNSGQTRGLRLMSEQSEVALASLAVTTWWWFCKKEG